MIRYVVTDIANVARYLSFGCLGPVTLHDAKYRPDASEQHGGALVLFEDARAGVGLLARSGGVPVVLEVDIGSLGGRSTKDGLVTTGSLLPASNIKRLHFRDESDSREFRTLEYQNVDPSAVESTISPHLFDAPMPPDIDAGSPGVSASQAMLEMDDQSHRSLQPLIERSVIEDIDRSVGAVCSLLRPIRPSRSLMGRVAAVLQKVLKADAGHDALVGEALLAPVDVSLHAAICKVCRAVSHEDVGHESVLGALEDSISADHLQTIRDMLVSNRDILPDELPSIPLRALLFALIAKKPTVLRSLPVDKSPAEEETELLALWYAGLREGGARRPVQERLGGFESLLQTWAARQGIAGSPPQLPKVSFKPKVVAGAGDGVFEYFLEDESFRVGPAVRPFPPTAERLKDVARQGGRATVWMADRLGVLIHTTIEFIQAMSFTVEGSRLSVSVPHRLDRSAEPEAVCAAIDGASPETLEELARRHLTAPPEAP